MKRIDLDANATTPVLPEVIEAMLPYFAAQGGNPSSAHAAGQRTRSAVEKARESVARLLHAAAKEIVFTSGGTESDNLALRGVLEPYVDRGESAHLITTQIEHHAVLYAAEALEKRGVAVTYLPANAEGVVTAEAVASALRPETRLISVMLANNETGAVQPVGKIARIAREHGVLMHTDAVQAAAKLPLDMSGEFKNVDLLSLSGHKMYAPQGTGALFVRKGVALQPLQFGGPQERQRRAGTENVPGVVALGKAAELAMSWLDSDAALALERLRDRLEQGILNRTEDVVVNASAARRVANTTNLRFAGVDAEPLLIALDMQGVSASFGAACMSGATEPSHVLVAMGLSVREARASLRLSLSRETKEEEIDRAIEIVSAAVKRLRALA
ncbi:MAG: cysteine desulfurase family protein [Acidobacteriaceae bacterium]|nr:cysteine desulfurase family protein [Acidobacteriaceae bacterium]